MRLQMKTKVKKQELIEKIKAALEEHREQYKKALEGWMRQMQGACEMVIGRVQSGKIKAFPSEFHNLMQIPSLHTSDYEAALKMLEMSVDDVIELEPEDFDQLVLGNWNWKEQWATTNSRYL